MKSGRNECAHICLHRASPAGTHQAVAAREHVCFPAGRVPSAALVTLRRRPGCATAWSSGGRDASYGQTARSAAAAASRSHRPHA